jgi:N4-gp56 family major capsid protein
MSQTHYDAADDEAKKLLEEELFREMEYESFHTRFQGKGADNIVQEKTQLESSKGDKVTFTLIKKLAGDGITGSSGLSLEGNEEKLVTKTQSVYLEEYAHATKDDGPLTRQRAFFSIDAESRTQLKIWGREKLEKLFFTAVFASPIKTVYGGDATSAATLETADKLTPAKISYLKTGAKTGWNRAQNPIQMIRVNGKMYYVLLVHPDVLYDLKQDSTFSQAMREAEVRGKENPIFTGATAIWDGVIIHEHELCPIFTTGGAGGDVPYAKCMLLGAQAILHGWGARPEIVPEEWDFKRKHGFGISMMTHFDTAQFDSKDYGKAQLIVSRTKVSDA